MPGKDTRIVQMQFDNRSFERNIATSQRSLERFKKDLNFDETSRGLRNFFNNTKNFAFDTFADNIQKLTDKFTGLGNAGEYVLSRLRASLESAAMQAERFVKSLTLEQIQSGQSKYDALTKSVQTIVASGKNTEQEAYAVMERVMEYTNQTSHSFETMVGQISTLTSIGIPLSKAEKLMEGFANSCTKAGADASKTAVALQTYAKGLGSYLTKQEFDTLNLTARVIDEGWRKGMIEAGLATKNLEKDTKGVIRTAKKFGKQVVVTVDNLESTLNTKWADRGTLRWFAEQYEFGDTIEDLKHPEKSMDSLGKTAYLTGQRALTFADALNAVKESISGGWMTTFRIMFGDLTDAMNLWTGSCNKVIDMLSTLADTRNKILESFRFLGGRDSVLKLIFGEMEDTEGNAMYEGAYGLIDVLNDIGNMISEAFWGVIKNLIPKEQQEAFVKEINTTFGTAYKSFDELWNSDWFKENGGREGWIGSYLNIASEKIGESLGKIRDYFNETVDDQGTTRLQMVENVLVAIGRTIAFIFEIIGGIGHFLGVLFDQDHLGKSVDAISDMFSKLGLSIVDAENDASQSGGIVAFFDGLIEILNPAIGMINDIVASLTDLILAISGSEDVGNAASSTFGSITGAIRSVWDGLMKFAQPIVDFVTTVMDILTELFQNGVTDENVAIAKEKIAAAFNIMLTELKTLIQPILEAVGSFFATLWEEIKQRVAAYFDDPNSLGHQILEPIKKVIAFLQPVWDLLKNVWESVKGLFVGKDGKLKGPTLFDTLKIIFASEGVRKLFSTLKDLAKDGGLYKLLMGVLGVVAVWQIIKAVRTIGGFFDDVGGNLKAGILGTYEWFSEKIQGIAKGILMLTASVAVLGMMNTGSVIQGVVALGVIMLEFVGFMKLMNTVNPATIMQQAAFTAAIGIFAGAIALLVAALLPFALVGWEGFARMIGGLTLVLLDLIGFMELMKVLGLSTRGLKFAGITRFALAIGILNFSLIPFMIADWPAIIRGIAGMSLVLLDLIGFMELMKVLGLSTFGLNFAGIARFALAIGILNFSLIPFMIADWESMLRGIAGLALVLVDLLGFMELMKVLGLSTFGLNFAGIARFALAISMLMLSLIPFMVTNWEGMLRAVVGLGIVLGELIGFMELMKVLSLSTLGLDFAGMTTFSISLGILMLSLIPFMSTDWGGMLRAVIGLGVVLAELIGFMELMKVLGLSTFGLDFSGILGFTISISILILALKSFAYMEWDQWARAVAGLAVVLLEIIGFMALVNLVPMDSKKMGLVIAICLSISAMALLLSIAINEVRNVDWGIITAFTVGLSAIILAMAGAMSILAAIPMTAGLKGIVLITAGIAAIVSILSLTIPMLMSSIGSGAMDFGSKMELVASMLSGFSTKMAGVDEGNVDKAISVLEKIRTMAAKVLGWGNYAFEMDGFAYAMFTLGTGMEIFNRHVGSSVGDLGTNGDAALKFIQDLSGCANDLDTISKMNFDALITRISGLGGALYLFAKGSQEAEGYEMGETPDVTGAMTVLREISKALTAEGGFEIPENMPDEDTIGTFGAQIAALALALVEFEKAGSGLGKGTDKALGVLDFFRRLKNKLAETGFKTKLFETLGIFKSQGVDKSMLTEFGTNIEQLGLSLKAFADSTTSIDAATGEIKPLNFDSALSALDGFAALQGKLGFEFGPLIQFFIGRNRDLNDLATQLNTMGTAIRDTYDKLAPLKENGEREKFDKTIFDDALEVMTKVEDHLKAMQKKLGNVGGLFRIVGVAFLGRAYDMTDLQKQMEAFAASVSAVQSAKHDDLITTDELSGVYKIIDNVIEYLKTLTGKLGRVGGALIVAWNALAGRAYDMTDLQRQMEAFGASVTALNNMKYDKIISTDKLKEVYKVIDSVLDYLSGEDGLSKHMERVGGALDVLNTLDHGREYNVEDLKKDLTAFSEGVASLTTFNVDSGGKTIFNPEETQSVFDLLDSMTTYLNKLKTKLPNIGGIQKFLDTLWNGKEADFTSLGAQLGGLGSGLGAFYQGLTKDNGELVDVDVLNSALSSIGSMVTILRQMAFVDDLLDEGGGYDPTKAENKIRSITEYIRKIRTALGYIANGDRAMGYDGFGAPMAQLLNDFMAGLNDYGDISKVQSAADILNNVSSAISNLVLAAKNTKLEDGTNVSFNALGLSIASGVAEGIRNGTIEVMSAAEYMALKAKETFKKTIDSNSPSKVFMQLGGFISEGTALGIRSKATEVETASAELGEEAIGALALFSQLMSQDIDANPTITPVLDLSNVTAGSQAINEMLSGNRGMSLAGAGGDVSARSIPNTQKTTNEYTGQDLSGIYSRISDLGTRIDSLGNKVSNMQIVLDTGVLAGGVTDGVSRNLGNKITYRRRRN